MPHSRAPETGPESAPLRGEFRPVDGDLPTSALSAGLEIRLYDPNREPQNWTDFMRPDQCAVLFKDRATSAPLSQQGKPYPDATECTCLLFDHLDAAQRFCETRVRDLPSLVCEIFNSEGRAKPPLLVITHPDHGSDDDSGPASSRRRKFIVTGLFAAGAALFSINLWGENTLATFLASNCVLFGLRFLYWEYAVKHREQERRRRLEAHRRIERGDA
jgi:hypothetical protein